MSRQSTPVRRPGARAWVQLIRAEAKMIVRDTAGLIIPLGFPVLLMVMMSVGGQTDQDLGGGVTVFDAYVLPMIAVLVVTTVGVINMPSVLVTYRRTKILRRLAVTPASPAMVLVAQMLVSFAQIVVGVSLALCVGLLFMDAGPPTDARTALLVMVALCLAMYGVGMVIASVAPTPNAALALGLSAFFALGALGGMFTPIENLPEPLDVVGVWLPFGAGVEALKSAWLTEPVDWENWVSLGLTAVLGASVASAFFRWD